MQLYTSYYAKNAKHPNAVAISCGVPRWYTGRRYNTVAPSWDLVRRYKAGITTEEEYKEEYIRYLDDIGIDKVISGLKDGDVMLCYETADKFCHRHVLADWLIAHGHTVTELETSFR